MSFRTSLFTAAIAAFATFSVTTAHAQGKRDEAVHAAAREAEPAVIRMLTDMVGIESGSADGPGLLRMADYVQGHLERLGGKVERIKATKGPGELVKATWTGTGTRKLMLIAHLDTVYPKGILATQPIRQDGNRLYGPGIADDKGGIAVILNAIGVLQRTGWRDFAQLTVLFNPDEEVGSGGSGELIAQTAAEHDVVFSAEPTAAKAVAKNEALLLGAAGTATATLSVQGRQSHAGAAPELGRNALVELAHQILQTRDIAKEIPGAQLNWTTAQAGNVRNQIPDTATAGGDVRLTRPDAGAALEAALKAKVATPLVPDTRTTVTLEIGRPPFLANDAARALAKRAQQVYAEELDGRVLLLVPGSGGGTDAGYASRSGKPMVLESFGLAGFGYHAKDEYVELDSIVPRVYLLARMLAIAARP